MPYCMGSTNPDAPKTSANIIHSVVYPTCNRYLLKSSSLIRVIGLGHNFRNGYNPHTKHLLQLCAILGIPINDSNSFALNGNRRKIRTLNSTKCYSRIPDLLPRSQILRSAAINTSIADAYKKPDSEDYWEISIRHYTLL
jgi:hypothetical protein